jgi:thymidylate kinase
MYLKTAQKIFKVFNDESINYCHWKSNEHLLEGLIGKTDLDILVNEKQKEECQRILKETGFKQVFSPSFLRYPQIEDWIGFDEKSGNLLHLHLHYKLLTGKKLVKEQYLPWDKLMLESRVFDEDFGIFTTNPNLELIVLAARIGIKTNFIKIFNFLFRNILPENIIKELRYLYEKSNKQKVEVFCKEIFGDKEGEKFTELIFNLISLPRPINVLKIKFFVLAKLYNYRRYGIFRTNIKYFFNISQILSLKFLNKFGARCIVKKTIKPKGFIIATVGADGSGKSTVVDELYKWLSWKLDVHKFYLGLNKNIFMRGLRILTMNLRNFFSVRSKYKKIIKIQRLRQRGSVILTDRYPQNQFLGINDGPLMQGKIFSSRFFSNLSNYEKKIYKLIAEKYYPDMVIKLHIVPEIAFNRKKELNEEAVRKKSKIIKNLNFNKSIIVNIDTSQPKEKVFLEIKREIWENLKSQSYS